MRLLPRSLSGRLLVTATAAVALALALAAVAIGHVLERFVSEGMDARLDAQLELVARAVRPDGSLDRTRLVDVPPYDRPGSGWAWQATAPGGTLRAASLGGEPLLPGPLPPSRHHRRADPSRPRPFETRGPDGQPLHGRVLILATSAGSAELVAAGPRRIVERPLRAATTPLLVSIALLGAALAGAVLVQLRLGLRPLVRLQSMVAEVREGRRRHVDVDEPTELLPLVTEVNALIDANEAGLAAARLHVANLAHGLKTPLATLRVDLARPGRDPDGSLAAQVGRLEDQVRHHLARARAADRGGRGPLVPLAPAVEALVDALRRLHADSAIVAEVRVPEELGVRCDPQDLDEALGNLLDNAWRHATERVVVAASAEARRVGITIADDGPGPSDLRLEELRAGTARADERTEGYGQGVRIARELVELHGGALDFELARPRGLTARILLPGFA